MQRKSLMIIALLLSGLTLSGCAAAAIGAGGAVLADEVAEDNGRNLF